MKKSILLFVAMIVAIINTNSFAQKQGPNDRAIAEYKFSGKNIRISSTNRNITLEAWKEDKIKIVTTALKDDNENEVLLEKMGITVHEMSSSFNINIKESSYGSSYNLSEQSNSVSSALGSVVPLNSKKNIIIYLPQSAKISVDVKYANLFCKNNFNNVDIDITNANLDLEAAKELRLISKYGNSTIGDIVTGDIDFSNGNLTINSINETDLDTKYSNVEIGTAKNLNFISTNDEYEIDAVDKIVGRKNYGNLRISKLNTLIDITGTNADVKVKNITSTVNAIKFDNKYANLRLPIKNLKDYAISVTGMYNTVYPDDATADLVNNNANDTGNLVNIKNGKGNGTKVQIKCANCTIDFK